MARIVITAETGSDITRTQAFELGIELVAMHVSIGKKTIDDGTLAPAEMLEQCRQLGVLPRTSGSTPVDFQAVFDRIHKADPSAQILHLAYSGVTTCSLDSAHTAAEGRDYVRCLDTKQVTIGQAFIVTQTARWVRTHSEATLNEAAAYARQLIERTRMAFIPGDLGYLRAGGRLSNAAFLGATLLKIKPTIEIIDGKLLATKKMRGSTTSVALRIMDYMTQKELVDTQRLFLVHSSGLPEEVQRQAEAHAHELGFQEVTWYDTGNVITTHAGPGAFGLAFCSTR